MENLRPLLTKKPWVRTIPSLYGSMLDEGITLTQADFLREYYPSSHAIMNPAVYPDIYRQVEEPIYNEDGSDTGERKVHKYRELVPRFAFAFQQIITLKQLIHLTGNDIQFDLNGDDKQWNDTFSEIQSGWQECNMELYWYKLCKSVKATADGALVGYLDKGQFGCKVLSFKDGDTLYPHHDPLTGRINLFARSFTDYDMEGVAQVEWVEVWDDKYYRLYKKGLNGSQTVKEKFLGIFGLEGYSLVKAPQEHGFPFCPVAYFRDDDGACWTPSQDSIDGYELSFSQMSHNNKAYGFPILVIQTESGANIDYDISGTIKQISIGTGDKVDYVAEPSASEAFMKELNTLYKMIYEQSFTVIPPELKSGDLPAAALKILYSPAYEKAMSDAMDYQDTLNQVLRIFLWGYGIQKQRTIDFTNCPVSCFIRPYVHVSESTIMSDLATGVQNGFLSHKTASERIKFYTSGKEWERLVSEAKEDEKNDILAMYEKQKMNEK